MFKRINKQARGFTLVELLIVIAIIAVLAGLLLPTLQGAREEGNKAACTNNLKQIGIMLLTYMQDEGRLPDRDLDHEEGGLEDEFPFVFGTADESIGGVMYDYAESKELFYCPSNSKQFSPATSWIDVLDPVTNLIDPSVGKAEVTYQFPHFVEEDNRNITPYPSYSMSGMMRTDTRLCMDICYVDGKNPDMPEGADNYNHTRSGGVPEGMNTLFGDGHVRWLIAEANESKWTKFAIYSGGLSTKTPFFWANTEDEKEYKTPGE